MFKDCNQNLDEILKCVICYEKLSDAKMCPFCSKLFCKHCIRKWLTENRLECPHCRSGLRLDNVITCRFVKDLNQALESLSQTRSESTDRCELHDCPLNYFCSTCEMPICSDCAMFSSDHKGHDFLHLSAVYSQHMQQIELERTSLKKQVFALESLSKEIDSKYEKFSVFSAEKSRELSNFMDNARSRLEDQLALRLEELKKKKKKVLEEIDRLEDLQEEIERETGLAGKSKLISISSDLVQRLKSQTLDMKQFEIQPISYEFESEVIPTYESAEFELKDFSIVQNCSEVVYSQNLEFNGLVWRLKVYPNGNGVAKNNYLSVFIELVKGYPGSARYDYKVEMINLVDPTRSVQREYNSDFEQGECWGYNRFYRIDLLREEGYLDGNDSLHMKFFIRPPTFYQMAKDQANFIRLLKEKEESSKKRFQDIVEKIDQVDVENTHQGFLISPEEVSEDRESSDEFEKWNCEQCRFDSYESVNLE